MTDNQAGCAGAIMIIVMIVVDVVMFVVTPEVTGSPIFSANDPGTTFAQIWTIFLNVMFIPMGTMFLFG